MAYGGKKRELVKINCMNVVELRIFLNYLYKITAIPWFTSFRLYEMHKLIPIFRFTNHFSFVRTPSSRKPIVVPVGK
jgi:hypothetical protein